MINEIEKQALSLPEQDRARLADRLIASLPEDFIDDDEIEEALRRSREMDEDPDTVISLEEFDRFFEERLNAGSLSRQGEGWKLEIVEHYENTAGSKIARDFFAELRYLVERIAERPESFPVIRTTLRKAVLRQFPYQIVFEKIDKEAIKILVVRHNRRRPSHGMRRR